MMFQVLARITCVLCFVFVSNADEDECYVGGIKDEKYRLFPQEPECGIAECYDSSSAVSSRIRGGKESKLGQYPWIARIVVSYAPTWFTVEWATLKQQKCVGSIINKKHILTAGHCFLVEETNRLNLFPLDISKIEAYVGDWDLSVDPDSQDGKNPPGKIKVGVEKVFFHPGHDFAVDHMWYDMALMRLTEELTFNDYVKPICLPLGCSREPSAILAFGMQQVYQAGWGYFGNDKLVPNRLQFSDSTLFFKQACTSAWSAIGVTLADYQVCVYANRTHTPCPGDSGSPLMITRQWRGDTSKCISYSMGVLSLGKYGCGETEGDDAVPAVFTWLPMLLDWVVENVKE